MKKKFRISLLISILFILSYCAKPEVVNIVMPKDEKLNCEELKNEFLETRRFKKEAEKVKEVNTGGNMTRTIIFWPALVKTLHNADVAIKAADDRGYHIINIMKNKKCKDADRLFEKITKTSIPVNISAEIKRLHKLYKKGALTEEEFEQAKKKVLSQ